MFTERLADPLGDGAVALALHQERVENAPEIVDRGVADDAHGPGRALDLHLAHMAAVGEGHGAGHVVDMAVEAERLHPRPERGVGRPRPQRWIQGGARDLGESDPAVCAGDAVVPVLEGDILRARLQQGGGDRAALLHSLLRRAADGVAADRERARAAGAAAVGDERAVPLPHAHVAEGNTQRAGDDLRERGLVPLPRRLAADQQRRRALGIEAQRRPLVAVAAAGVHVEREPDAAQTGPLPRVGPPPAAHRAPAAFFTRLLKYYREVTGIVCLSEGRAVGHRGRGDEIAPAQRGGVEAELVRRLVSISRSSR